MSSVESHKSEAVSNEKVGKLQEEYNKFKEILAELQNQFSAIGLQIQEHTIVDKTLSSIEPSKRANRKCFKMIGGVLIEKSVDDVIRIIHEETNKLKSQRDALGTEVQKVNSSMEKWIKENNVKVMSGPQA